MVVRGCPRTWGAPSCSRTVRVLQGLPGTASGREAGSRAAPCSLGVVPLRDWGSFHRGRGSAGGLCPLQRDSGGDSELSDGLVGRGEPVFQADVIGKKWGRRKAGRQAKRSASAGRRASSGPGSGCHRLLLVTAPTAAVPAAPQAHGGDAWGGGHEDRGERPPCPASPACSVCRGAEPRGSWPLRSLTSPPGPPSSRCGSHAVSALLAAPQRAAAAHAALSVPHGSPSAGGRPGATGCLFFPSPSRLEPRRGDLLGHPGVPRPAPDLASPSPAA